MFVSETTSNKYRFEWELKWDELKKKGVKHLFGTITPETNDKLVPSIDFSVDEKRSTSNLETSKDWLYNIPFKYKIFYKESDYSGLTLEELFKPSERNDAVLVIGGTKMHVNKALLSFHSEYFRALFSSNFKEGKLTEIPMYEVSYEDFSRMLAVLYGNEALLKDDNLEKMLELADQFQVPRVTAHIETHLCHFSKMKQDQLMRLADKFNLRTIIEKIISEVDTTQKMKNLKNSAVFWNLSDETKVLFLYRLMQLI